jgi:outer membrane receptor protein involved in Fe transport
MTNQRTRARRTALMCGAAVAFVLSASPVMAQDQVASIDIPAQSMASALRELARQSGANVLFSPEAVRGLRAQQLQTSATPEEAARLLLAGTDLTVMRDPTGSLVVRTLAPQSGSAAGGGAEVEALIVTAQKREEDIQDVPIAISAFSQEDLTRSQVAGGPDLITQVPNMTFTKTNFSSYSIQLRGIGTQAISATTDPAVAVAFNNTPFIRNRFFEQEFYDLQRVEVLRGPQGTLYGRNATAGVVNLISQKPKFVAEAKASADVSNFNSSRLEGMINLPLVEDKVALRIAGAWTKRDGYATNDLTGNPIDGRDLWSTRVSLRVAPNDRIEANLIWEHFQEKDDRIRSGKQLCKKNVVTEVLAGGLGPNGVGMDITDIPYFADLPGGSQSLAFSGVQGTLSQGCERNSLYAEDSFQTPNGLMLPYYVPAGAIGLPALLDDPYLSTVQSRDLRAIESTIDPDYRASADIGELQVSFDLTDRLTLTSETAYGTDFVRSLQDFNRFNTAAGAWGNRTGNNTNLLARGVLRDDLGENLQFCDPQLGCSDRLVAVDISTAKATQFSQEFRLSSDYEGDFNFSLGANFLRADSEDKYYVFINSLSLLAANGLVSSSMIPFYEANVTDNAECMANGYMPGNPNFAYGVASCVYMDPNPLDSINDEGHNYFLSKNPYKLISYAVFGEGYYQITDNLKVTAGLRWTVDKKEAPKVPTWLLVSQSIGYPVDEVIEQEWREPTGRLTVDWKPDLSFTDETLVYASYAHGYKAGGANPPGYVRSFYSDRAVAIADAAESATRPKTFAAEFVDAYELGSKNTLLDGSMTLNLAAFYYDYKDYQISEIVDRSAFNRNFDATVWGLELEADWRVQENLRFGLKVGYEETSIADGEQAIDLMDRTAGDPNWVVVRPFPTYASSCILPSWLFAHEGPVSGAGNSVPNLYNLGMAGGGGPGGCELAYVFGVDPVLGVPGITGTTLNHWFPNGYPGWDPETAPNGGEGIMKDLGGNELPNAPNLTATITADYTIPLPSDWLVNLHTDLHWQAESDWRVFQDHDYSKLDEYFTMNLAAIFTNEERGWNIMAYIKNVTDETAITGAFLNSDDTGLTTNVFLTEPRLYGIRVTKAWTGSSTWGPFGARREGPFPLTVELGGQVQHHDARNAALQGGDSEEFDGLLDISDDAQAGDLDWGDGRDVRLTWRPSSGPFSVSLGARSSDTNGRNRRFAQWSTEPACVYSDPDLCAAFEASPDTFILANVTGTNHADALAINRESHEFYDLMVGNDFDLGPMTDVVVSLGIMHARLGAETDAGIRGVPDWVVPQAFFELGALVTHTSYDITINAEREFSGFGPKLGLATAFPLLASDDWGKVELDLSGSGGVLFGDREVTISGEQKKASFVSNGFDILFPDTFVAAAPTVERTTFVGPQRSEGVTAPFVDLSVGLAYEVGAFRVGAGYRWERYFDALDVGYDEAEDGDRTIDGPYLKIAVGFGG